MRTMSDTKRMIPTTFTFLTIVEWLRDNPDLEIEKAECMTCDGTGDHQCDCGDEHECGNCNGTGLAQGCTYPELYIEQLKRDVDRLKKYYRLVDDQTNPISVSLDASVSMLIRLAHSWRPKVSKQ